MDVALLLKIIGIGLIVSVAYQVLAKSGRDEQAMLVSLSGIVIILLLIVNEFGSLISNIRQVFGV